MRSLVVGMIALLIIWLVIDIVGTPVFLLYDWSQEDDRPQGLHAYAKDWMATQSGYVKAHAVRVFAMVFNVFRQAFGALRIRGDR